MDLTFSASFFLGNFTKKKPNPTTPFPFNQWWSSTANRLNVTTSGWHGEVVFVPPETPVTCENGSKSTACSPQLGIQHLANETWKTLLEVSKLQKRGRFLWTCIEIEFRVLVPKILYKQFLSDTPLSSMYLPFDVYSLKQTWTCLRCLEQVKHVLPKWWFDGDLPWYFGKKSPTKTNSSTCIPNSYKADHRWLGSSVIDLRVLPNTNLSRK